MVIGKKKNFGLIPPPTPYMANAASMGPGIPVTGMQSPADMSPLDFDQTQGIIPSTYFGNQGIGTLPPPPAVSMGPDFAEEPEPTFAPSKPDTSYYDSMKAIIDKLNDPAKEERRADLESKVFSLMANGNQADRRQAKATEIFGNVIAPAMGLFGGPAASAAATQVTKQAQAQAQQYRQQQNQDAQNQVSMLKFMKDIGTAGDKDAIAQVVQLQLMHGQQQRDQRQADLEAHRLTMLEYHKRKDARTEELRKQEDAQRQNNLALTSQARQPGLDDKHAAALAARELDPLKKTKLEQDVELMEDPDTPGTMISRKAYIAKTMRKTAEASTGKIEAAAKPGSPERRAKEAQIAATEAATVEKISKISEKLQEARATQNIIGATPEGAAEIKQLENDLTRLRGGAQEGKMDPNGARASFATKHGRNPTVAELRKLLGE